MGRKRFKQIEETDKKVTDFNTSCRPFGEGDVEKGELVDKKGPMNRLNTKQPKKNFKVWAAHKVDDTFPGEETVACKVDIPLSPKSLYEQTEGNSKKSRTLAMEVGGVIDRRIKSSPDPVHCHTGLTQEMEDLHLSAYSGQQTSCGEDPPEDKSTRGL